MSLDLVSAKELALALVHTDRNPHQFQIIDSQTEVRIFGFVFHSSPGTPPIVVDRVERKAEFLDSPSDSESSINAFESQWLNKNSIGTATMEHDGTLILQLRAESEGIRGDASLTYRTQDKNYAQVLSTLTGISPGVTVPVPPNA